MTMPLRKARIRLKGKADTGGHDLRRQAEACPNAQRAAGGEGPPAVPSIRPLEHRLPIES